MDRALPVVLFVLCIAAWIAVARRRLQQKNRAVNPEPIKPDIAAPEHAPLLSGGEQAVLEELIGGIKITATITGPQPGVSREAQPKEYTKFDAFMDERCGDGAKWLSATIAGATHDNPDGSSRQAYIRELKPMQELSLEREPHNTFSSRAIAVKDAYGHQLGYIPEWLARDVSDAMDSGGVAACYVQHIRQTSSTNWAAAIGVLWREKLSPRNEFRKTLDARADVEEWFWAKLSGMHEFHAQSLIEALTPGEELTVDADEAILDGGKVKLTSAGEEIARLSKAQSEQIVAGLNDGRRYEALVFEVRERVRGKGLEPVVAILLLKEG